MNLYDLWADGKLDVIHSVTYYNRFSETYLPIPKKLFKFGEVVLFKHGDKVIAVTDKPECIDWYSEVEVNVKQSLGDYI